MRISVDWLADYVALPPGLKPEQIATDLTMATVEVEGVVRLGRELEWVKIARVGDPDGRLIVFAGLLREQPHAGEIR